VKQALDRSLRIAATGISFATFGAAGLLCGFVLLPLVRLAPGSARERDFRCQFLVRRFFRLFIRLMESMGLLRVSVHGADRLEQTGQLIVANHPTLLDAVFLVSLMPRADCVVKSAVLSNPFMRSVARCTGYLSNELQEDLISACAERLQSGRSLILLPEGTRSPRGGLGPFQRGAAHVALHSGLPLRPVVIRCDPPGLMRGQKWYDVADRRLEISLECCEPIHVGEISADGRRRGAAARRVTAELRDFFLKRLQTLPR
jgi:1-acyl-sn-glycerol-3-phosphate acyltransferase